MELPPISRMHRFLARAVGAGSGSVEPTLLTGTFSLSWTSHPIRTGRPIEPVADRGVKGRKTGPILRSRVWVLSKRRM